MAPFDEAAPQLDRGDEYGHERETKRRKLDAAITNAAVAAAAAAAAVRPTSPSSTSSSLPSDASVSSNPTTTTTSSASQRHHHHDAAHAAPAPALASAPTARTTTTTLLPDGLPVVTSESTSFHSMFAYHPLPSPQRHHPSLLSSFASPPGSSASHHGPAAPVAHAPAQTQAQAQAHGSQASVPVMQIHDSHGSGSSTTNTSTPSTDRDRIYSPLSYRSGHHPSALPVPHPLPSPTSTHPSAGSLSAGSVRPRFVRSDTSHNSTSRMTGTIALEGYRDVRIMGTHYEDVVACRAVSIARGDQRVFIKLSLSANPLAAAHFKAESGLLAQLWDAGIHNCSRVLAREVGRLGTMMIVADDNLKSFDETFELGSMSLHRPNPYWDDTTALLNAIDLAIKLIRVVALTHRMHIVHGSLRPQIISTSLFGEVHVHDFSCAFRAGPEGDTNPIRERGLNEESLPYIAPECSGRVGKSADYRSDYYSLGATLYEIFTGQVPFADAIDPLNVVHAHITRRPALMSTVDSSIPPNLSLVVAKLLEKSQDARYQTSEGIVVDLNEIAKQIRKRANSETSGRVSAISDEVTTNPFDSSDSEMIIGGIDSVAHFRLPPSSKMYGRDRSIEQLLAALQLVRESGKPTLIVVKGPSGVGKTTLVEAVRRPVMQARGYYTSVKFDQIKSPVPFFAITQSLSGLFRQILSEPEAQLIQWRRRLNAALGKEGRALADVLPALENVFEPGWIETLPPLVPIGAAESEQRFQTVVRAVLRTFARSGKPLVIVFDDLQWSTPSDIAFIRSLLPGEPDSPSSASGTKPMLLIALWRDNEVGPDHIVTTQLLDKVQDVHLSLSLEPLLLADVIAFVSESLRMPVSASRSGTHSKEDPNIRTLSEMILATTRGSPLFVAQLLKSFNTEGFFKFDFEHGKWIYDLDLIASRSVLTDVVELLLAQMRRFPPATQYALMVAACLGNEELKSTMLAQAVGRTLAELSADLHDATEEGMLVSIGEIATDAEVILDGNAVFQEGEEAEAKLHLHASSLRAQIGLGAPKGYRFFHDRCQQAAYALIPVEERSTLHYEIGQRLIASMSDDKMQECIFDLANQLNHAIETLSTDEDRDRLARYNHMAGLRANKSTAFEAAREYLQIAWDLLGAEGWTRQHQLMSEVTEALIDVEYSLTDYPAAQEFVRIFLSRSEDVVAKLRVYARAVRCGSAMGDSLLAIKIAREGLAMVGISLPEDGKEADVIVDQIREELHLTVDSIKALADLEQMSDPIALGVQNLLGALIPPVYFAQIELLGGLTSLAVRNAVKHGLSDASALLFTLHAVLVQAKYGERDAGLAYGDVAIGYFEKYGGTPYACPTYKVVSSHIIAWSKPIAETLPGFRQAIAYGMQYRDAEYVGFSCGEMCSYGLLSGAPLPGIVANVEGYALLVRKFRHELSTLYIGVIQQALLCLSGSSIDPLEIEGEAFSVADYQICADRPYSTDLHLFHMLRLMVLVLFNCTTTPRALESIRLGREHIAGCHGLLYPTFFMLFEAICFYDRFSELSDDELATLDATLVEFDALARNQPDNFLPLKLWLDAESARVSSQRDQALDLYDLAISKANASGYVQFAACMNERCAKMLQIPKLAAGYVLEAHALWTTWGCLPKMSSMAAEYPLLLPRSGAPPLLSPVALNLPTAASLASPPIDVTKQSPNSGVTTDSSGSGVRSGVGSSAGSGAAHDSAIAVAYDDADSTTGSYGFDEHGLVGTGVPDRPIGIRRTSSGSHESRSSRGEMDILGERGSLAHVEHQGTRSMLATELDLRTVVSASAVITQELSVDGVVSKLLSLALRTAGAEMCLLVLDKGGSLCAEAMARSDASDVQHLRRLDPVDAQPERYPCSVINYVARSKSMVVNNLDALGDSITDLYLKQRKPLSILCLALASQSRVIGVLYMENSQTENAFTLDRLEILALVSGQAASTIERARLVQDLKLANTDLKRSQAALEGYNRNLEETVEDRTLELRHKNELLLAEIAEKERAQAEMRSAKEIAESATAMKSQFLANMSHEIRTPFNAVVALAGLLLDTSLTPVQTDYVETIKNSSQELLVVINDILDYSKIELDHLELSRDTVQLRNVLESSMDMLAERAASKSVELALVIEQNDINILGDLTRLRQIVVNLLSNAVKFTSQGEIIVTASSRKIERNAMGEQMCRVTISVQDTGIGIAKEHYNRLFRVFSQVEGTETTKQFGGTGLGLAISRKLSLLMGGDITVDSEVGKGSTFLVTFVAPIVEGPETDHYSAAQNPDLAGKRCLVVDGNATSRMVLHQLVSSFGLVTDAPEDTIDAYAIAQKAVEAGEPHDVIIVDAFLPGFAAQILLRRLRQAGISMPAIVLTRMGSPIYEEMRQLECQFLIKPIKRNRLHHTLRQIFPAGDSIKTSPPPVSSAFPTGLGVRNPLSILCAEDNPINVKVITHLLKRMGYTTDVAEDGVIALEKVQRKKYDIVFMDVNMPNMDGLEATRRIIELMPNPSSRPMIVCLTANAMSDDRDKCLAAGGDGYVSKPILVPDLVAALNDASARVQRRRLSLVGAINNADPSNGSGSPIPYSASSGFELELPTSRLGRLSRASSLSSRGTPSPARSPGVISPRNQDRDGHQSDPSPADSTPSPPIPRVPRANSPLPQLES